MGVVVGGTSLKKRRSAAGAALIYKAQVVDNTDGIILNHSVQIGNPADAPQLAPAIQRITTRTGRTPTAVTADRGYGYTSVETDLHDIGVRYVTIPRVGKTGAARTAFEQRKAFRAKVKWRTGCEERINHLKRNYGWNRIEFTTIAGARTWCGHGPFSNAEEPTVAEQAGDVTDGFWIIWRQESFSGGREKHLGGPLTSTKRIGSQTQPRSSCAVTRLNVVSAAHFFGIDNVPIDVASPRRPVTVAPRAPPSFGSSVPNAAALLRRFRCLIAESIGALSELSLDRDDVTDDRGV